jgi:hypothetical protein
VIETKVNELSREEGIGAGESTKRTFVNTELQVKMIKNPRKSVDQVRAREDLRLGGGLGLAGKQRRNEQERIE